MFVRWLILMMVAVMFADQYREILGDRSAFLWIMCGVSIISDFFMARGK